jgi:hypothetical protein
VKCRKTVPLSFSSSQFNSKKNTKLEFTDRVHFFCSLACASIVIGGTMKRETRKHPANWMLLNIKNAWTVLA